VALIALKGFGAWMATFDGQSPRQPGLMVSAPACWRVRSKMARLYHTFGDIEGKLDVLRVECTKCERKKCPG
jgi:hypothetical protein